MILVVSLTIHQFVRTVLVLSFQHLSVPNSSPFFIFLHLSVCSYSV